MNLHRLLTVLTIVAVMVTAGPYSYAQDEDALLGQEVTLEFLTSRATLSLPDGWVVQPFDEGVYILGKDEDSILLITEGIQQVFDNIVSELEGGDDVEPTPTSYEELVVGLVAASDKAELGLVGLSLTEFIEENFASSDSPFPPDMIEESELDGHAAVLVPLQLSPDDIPDGAPDNLQPSGLVVVVDYDTFFLIFMGMALAETNQEPLFEAILASLEVDDGTTPLPAVAYEHELFDMLGMVPASMARVEGAPQLSYVNYRAVEQVWVGVPTPESWEDLMSLSDSDTDAGAFWIANARRILSGPPILGLQSGLESMPEVMGFDFFDIDRGLILGQPPEEVFILGGDFDGDTIAAAHRARDYTATDLGGASLWCGPVGCENGLQIDPANREPANIFGGDLGRQFPFAVLPGHLVTSGLLSAVHGAVVTYQDAQNSLLDVPSYRAVAEAITQDDGVLLQVQFFQATDVGFMPPDFLSAHQELIDETLGSYGTLPLYELAALVDRQHGNDQVAMMVLVYDNENSARSGAEELTSRIVSFSRLDLGQTEPMLDIPEIDGRVGGPSVFYSEAADKWIAMATALYPIPEHVSPSETRSGLLFRFWVDSLYRRTLTPLVVDAGS